MLQLGEDDLPPTLKDNIILGFEGDGTIIILCLPEKEQRILALKVEPEN